MYGGVCVFIKLRYISIYMYIVVLFVKVVLGYVCYELIVFYNLGYLF